MTLNAAVNLMKRLALDLKPINSFVEEESNEVDIIYPTVICQKQPGTIDRSTRQTLLNFKIFFVDLLTETNRLEVESDMLGLAQDYKALLEDPAYDDDWDVSASTSYQFVDSKFNEDEVTGVAIDVSIGLRYLSDRCQIPLKSDEAGIYLDTVNGILSTTDTGKLLDIS